jgi:integrase/recombinase XerD
MTALIDMYRKELSGVAEYARDTVDTYVSCIVMFFEFGKELGIDPLFARGTHIIKWIASLQSKGLSPSRLEHHRSALRLFFALMIKRKILVKNPVDRLPPIRKIRTSVRIKPVPKKVAFKLLAAIDQTNWHGRRDWMIVSMLWALGLRISELTSLRVKSFEPEFDPSNRAGLLRVKGKNRKWRVLFVVDRLYDELVSYLSDPLTPSKKNDPLFCIRAGTPISINRVQKFIKEFCMKAGIKQRITPHVLRHSFATEMYHCGTPLQAVQVMMGHDHKAETAVYVHVSDELQRQALSLIHIEGGMPWYVQQAFLNM